MPIGGRFGQQADAADAEAGHPGRKERQARLAAEPWPRLIAKVVLQLIALFALASLLVWLSSLF